MTQFLKKGILSLGEKRLRMRTQKHNLQGIKVFFYILMIAILGWFVFMQLFGANEQDHDVQSHSVVYTQSFYWEKEDVRNKK